MEPQHQPNPHIHQVDPATWGAFAALTGRGANNSSSPLTPQTPLATDTYDSGSNIPLPVAQSISRLFRSAYGVAYPSESAYSADAYADAVARGELAGLVIAKPGDPAAVLAHCAVMNLGRETYEIGKLLVAAEARGLGLGNRLAEEAARYARLHDPALVLALPFTSHTASQKIFEHIGFTPVGLMVRDWPDVFGNGAAEGALITVDPTSVRFNGARQIFAPESLRPLLEFAYAKMNCIRTFEPIAAAQPPPALKIVPDVRQSEYGEFRKAQLIIPPQSEPAQIEQITDSLLSQGMNHLSADVNLTDPSAPAFIAALQTRGFFFASVLPCEHGDILTMQRPEVPFDQARAVLKLQSADSNHLADLISASIAAS